MVHAKIWTLRQHFVGFPKDTDFELKKVNLPEPQDGGLWHKLINYDDKPVDTIKWLKVNSLFVHSSSVTAFSWSVTSFYNSKDRVMCKWSLLGKWYHGWDQTSCVLKKATTTGCQYFHNKRANLCSCLKLITAVESAFLPEWRYAKMLQCFIYILYIHRRFLCI